MKKHRILVRILLTSLFVFLAVIALSAILDRIFPISDKIKFFPVIAFTVAILCAVINIGISARKRSLASRKEASRHTLHELGQAPQKQEVPTEKEPIQPIVQIINQQPSTKESLESVIEEIQDTIQERIEDRLNLRIKVSENVHRAALVIYETGQPYVAVLQDKLKWSYYLAAHALECLEKAGVVGKAGLGEPREILIDEAEYLAKYKIVKDNTPLLSFDVAPQKKEKPKKTWNRPTVWLTPVERELVLIDEMDGHTFERWCAKLLLASGFSSAAVTQKTKDQGVDVVAVLDGERYAIQCKRYSSNIGNSAVQQAIAGARFYHCRKIAVLTNMYFTASAMELAQATKVHLWDRDWITGLLNELDSSKLPLLQHQPSFE